MMKRNPDFVKRNIMGEIILVPTANTSGNMNGLIALNEVGSFIFDLLPNDDSKALAEAVVAEFEVDYETALADVEMFLLQLKAHKVIE